METIFGIVRALLAAGAGYLAGKGYIDVGATDELVGAGLLIITAIWSALAKNKNFPAIK
jgi:hypothetical protein